MHLKNLPAKSLVILHVSNKKSSSNQDDRFLILLHGTFFLKNLPDVNYQNVVFSLWGLTVTSFHKFILNMRLLLQFLTVLLTLSIGNLLLNRTIKDEKHALS